MKKKELDFDLYKATDKMLTDYIDIDTCIELYETEKVLMPLMIHENYHKFNFILILFLYARPVQKFHLLQTRLFDWKNDFMISRNRIELGYFE